MASPPPTPTNGLPPWYIFVPSGNGAVASVITYLVTEDKEVYLTYIYDKSQLENITK